MKELNVGIIGFGTVGAGVAEILLTNREVIAKRTGVMLTLKRIADLDITTDRGVKVPDGVLTTDAAVAIDEWNDPIRNAEIRFAADAGTDPDPGTA